MDGIVAVARSRAMVLAGLCGVLLWGCSGAPSGPGAAGSGKDADKLLIVDCLLPPQVRRLGTQTTYLSARRPVRTSAADCELRGGEYVAFDRADYRTALAVWMPEAEAGNAEAQNHVGQIHERGLGVAPDYAAAASWYRRAAEQGHQSAQINLGNLYDRGLGVPRDGVAALNWYRRAAGISDDSLMYASAVAAAEVSEAELTRLRGQLQQARERASAFQQQLQEAQQQIARQEGELQRLRGDREDKQLLHDLLRQQPPGPERDRNLERLQRELGDLVPQLEAAERELGTLRQRADRAQRDVARASDAVVEAGRAAPPRIEVIDPPVSLTRGMATAQLEPARQSRELIGRVDAPAGVSRFSINGREHPLDEFNLFWAEIELTGETTPVNIGVRDARQREVSYQFLIQSPRAAANGLATAPDTTGLRLGRYHALVIGNNRYTRLSDLETAVNDARAVERLLRERYGFQTRLLLDASRYDILSALNALRERLTADDNLLIYYAGHGELDTLNDRGYWLPVDAEHGSSANWISNVAITDMVNAMRARHVLVVADSCYSGTLSGVSVPRYAEGMPLAQQREWLETVAALRARTVLTSGGVQPVLDSGGGEHSLFARAFIETLESNQQLLEGFALYREVLRRVSARAAALNQEQTPEYAPIRHAGHEAGEFLFVPAGSRLGSR